MAGGTRTYTASRYISVTNLINLLTHRELRGLIIAPDATRTCDPRFRKPMKIVDGVMLRYTWLLTIIKRQRSYTNL